MRDIFCFEMKELKRGKRIKRKGGGGGGGGGGGKRTEDN